MPPEGTEHARKVRTPKILRWRKTEKLWHENLKESCQAPCNDDKALPWLD